MGVLLWCCILFLPVVAQLDGGAIEDAAEGDGGHLPVGHGIAEQTDARVHGFLSVVGGGTEVFGPHRCNLVAMEIDYL